MNDVISRQAAIDSIRKIKANYCETADDQILLIDKAMAMTELMMLPFAQPEQRKGKWIIRDNPGTGWYRVTCSECGEDVTSTIPMIGFFPNAKPLWDYCPYCGCKMEVEDNGKQ